jgi:hypothetical protein
MSDVVRLVLYVYNLWDSIIGAAYQLVPEKDFLYHDAVTSETEILFLARIESLYILVCFTQVR